jgi:uncharacterized protein (DUF4415 family)
MNKAPIAKRKGIKISARTRELYEKRNRASDDDPDARPLPPDKWASAMRRDEFFRPIKKQTTVRLDADVLDWLKSKGKGHGHITRVNEILRSAMLADLKGKPAASHESINRGPFDHLNNLKSAVSRHPRDSNLVATRRARRD